MGGSHSQEPQARRVTGRDWVLERRESRDWEGPHRRGGLPGPTAPVHTGQPLRHGGRQGPAGQVRNALHRTSQMETSLNNNKLTF